MKTSRKLAFTLIEMLMVVAIIAIIVGIAVPALNTAKNDAMNAKMGAIQARIQTAKARFLLNQKDLPESEQERWEAIKAYITVTKDHQQVEVNHIQDLAGFPIQVLIGGAEEKAKVQVLEGNRPIQEDSRPSITNTPQKKTEAPVVAPMETIPSEPAEDGSLPQWK